MRSGLGILALTTVTALACGDNTSGGSGFDDLVADPAVATGCLDEAVGAGVVRAKVVECEGEVPSGLLAAGRVGDIVIENAEIEIVIRASGAGFAFPATGAGGIIDAARVGGVDGLKEIIPLAELNSVHATEAVITKAGAGGRAVVVVRGHVEPIPLLVAAVGTARVPVRFENRYILEPDSSVVTLEARLLADENESANPQVGDLFFFGGTIAAWLPGVGIADEIANAEFVASVGDEVSFGVTYPAEQRAVQFLSIVNITGALGPSVEVGDRNATGPIVRHFIIGDGSVGSVTELAWQLRGQELGEVAGQTAPNVEVLARNAAGQPVTMARATDSGEYSLKLPPGDYELAAESLGRAANDPVSVSIFAGAKLAMDVAAGDGGTLRLTVTEESAGAIPARVVVRREGERRIHYAGASGEVTIPLPVGEWTVDVSRGVEYDAFTATPVTIAADSETTIEASLVRVLDTTGWISLDTHLHSEMSVDSTIPLEDRLHAVAAEGVEIAISTDHDFVTNYQPVIEKLGLEAFVNHEVGVETSTFAFGHFNAWPVEPNNERGGGGAYEWYEQAPDAIFAGLRSEASGAIIQINHPRNGSMGYFDLINFNRDLGMATQDPAAIGYPGADLNDFNFDAIEVGNDFFQEQFTESFADYLALVAAGHPAAATGSSDSHGPGAFVGNSRTYVFVGDGNDDPATVDRAAVDAALKARKVVVSQGSFIEARIEDPNTGDPAPLGTLVNLSGESDAVVHIKVQAPPWMPLRSIVVYQGRQIAATLLLDEAATETVRFDSTISVPLGAGDDFIVVVAEPAGPGTPVLGQPDASFTNPLLYDIGGDGSWK